LSLGKTDDALRYFSDELVIAERRMKADPADVDAKRFTSVVYNLLGDVFLKLGRTDDALTQFQDGLTISRVLAEADPTSAQIQWDVATLHIRLGAVHKQTGQFDQAVKQYTQSIEVLDALIANGQNVEQAQHRRTIVERMRQICAAAPVAIGDWTTLLQADSKILPRLLSLRFTELAKRGQLAEVAQVGAKLRDLATSAAPGPAEVQKGGMLYNAACAYGLCATLSLKDKPQPTDSEKAEQQKHLDLSLACLKEAVAAGYDNFEHIQQDSDLTPLRELPEFQALLKQRPAKKP
ncbi:MAG: TPR end-of-group domain-containing protein, partial [Planctomycetaceae bacterium]